MAAATYLCSGKIRQAAEVKPQEGSRTGGWAGSGGCLQRWTTKVHSGAGTGQWWFRKGKEVRFNYAYIRKGKKVNLIKI